MSRKGQVKLCVQDVVVLDLVVDVFVFIFCCGIVVRAIVGCWLLGGVDGGGGALVGCART